MRRSERIIVFRKKDSRISRYSFLVSVAIHALFFLWLHAELFLNQHLNQHLSQQEIPAGGSVVSVDYISPTPTKVPRMVVSVQQKKKTRPSQLENLSKKQANLSQTTANLNKKMGKANGQIASAEQHYLYEFRQFIKDRLVYPIGARKLRQTGKVLLKVRLLKDGKIGTTEIVEHCPFLRLNRAAIELVKSLKMFRPFPTTSKKEIVTVLVPIEYSLNL